MLWLSHLHPASWYFLPVFVMQTTSPWSCEADGWAAAQSASSARGGRTKLRWW